MESIREQPLERVLYVLLQPTRWKIIHTLKSKGPLYIEQLAIEIGEDRKTVSFHLANLAEYGFVESEYRVIEIPKDNPGNGKAGKYFWITKKVDEVLANIPKLMKPTSA